MVLIGADVPIMKAPATDAERVVFVLIGPAT